MKNLISKTTPIHPKNQVNALWEAWFPKFDHIKKQEFQLLDILFTAVNCVAPVLDYCNEVWGLQNYHSIELVQNRALRFNLGAHRFTPLPALHGEFGQKLSHRRHYMNSVRLWNRQLKKEDERITNGVFLWDLNKSRALNHHLNL